MPGTLRTDPRRCGAPVRAPVRALVRAPVRALVLALLFAGGADGVVRAQEEEPIKNPVARFSGLDKITTRIITFDVYMNETVQFGALRVTPRACHTQPPSEQPNTVAFVEIDEITLDSRIRRIFTGWMFAASPGLNAVDHAVYDVWLQDCAVTTDVPPPPGFDETLYAQDELGLISQPGDGLPMPRPRPQPPVPDLIEDPDVIED